MLLSDMKNRGLMMEDGGRQEIAGSSGRLPPRSNQKTDYGPSAPHYPDRSSAWNSVLLWSRDTRRLLMMEETPLCVTPLVMSSFHHEFLKSLEAWTLGAFQPPGGVPAICAIRSFQAPITVISRGHPGKNATDNEPRTTLAR